MYSSIASPRSLYQDHNALQEHRHCPHSELPTCNLESILVACSKKTDENESDLSALTHISSLIDVNETIYVTKDYSSE